MRSLLTALITISLVLAATSAFADRGHYRSGYEGHYGERIERHLDRKGDMIQHRFEHKALRAEARGKYHKADRMRAKGHRINRHLDREGDRLHAYYDRRHYRHSHGNTYRQYYVKPRIVYRSYVPFDSYFGLVLNQPGLSIRWDWHD